MVIGSHPHVVQRMERKINELSGYEDMVVYSLGNFVSNQRRPKTDGGAMVKVELTRKGEKYAISDAGYYLTWVYTPIEKYRKKFFILPCSQFESNPDFFDKPEAFSHMKRFISDSRRLFGEQNINVREYIYNGNSWVLNN